MKIIKNLAITVSLLSLTGLHAMDDYLRVRQEIDNDVFVNQPQRLAFRTQVRTAVRQRNVQALNNLLDRCRNGLQSIGNGNDFRDIVSDGLLHHVARPMLLGMQPCTQENLNWYGQLIEIRGQSLDLAIGRSGDLFRGYIDWIIPGRATLEAMRYPEGNPTVDMLNMWHTALTDALRQAIEQNDFQRINQILQANFDATHPWRERLRDAVIRYLLNNNRLTDQSRRVVQGFVNALPSTDPTPQQSPTIQQQQPVAQQNNNNSVSGNWFSNHKVATTFGIAAVGAIGYYMYTKWKKSKEKKKSVDTKQVQKKSSASPRVRRTKARKA